MSRRSEFLPVLVRAVAVCDGSHTSLPMKALSVSTITTGTMPTLAGATMADSRSDTMTRTPPPGPRKRTTAPTTISTTSRMCVHVCKLSCFESFRAFLTAILFNRYARLRRSRSTTLRLRRRSTSGDLRGTSGPSSRRRLRGSFRRNSRNPSRTIPRTISSTRKRITN